MIDLSAFDAATLTARGSYATVRGAHEDAKKALQIACGHLAAVASQVLRAMQPDNDAVPVDVSGLLLAGRSHLDHIDALVKQIDSLAQQRAELKATAWGN